MTRFFKVGIQNEKCILIGKGFENFERIVTFIVTVKVGGIDDFDFAIIGRDVGY